MDTFSDVKAELDKAADQELLQAVTFISGKVKGGLDIKNWAGNNAAWKAKYVDTLLKKDSGSMERVR